MRIVGIVVGLSLVLASQFGSVAANAGTITETINFRASCFKAFNQTAVPKDPVTGSFTFTLDNAKSYTDATSGLALHTLNISALKPLVFSYDPRQKLLTVGANAHANQYIWGTNDFTLSVFLNGPTPSGGFFGYSQAGHNDSYETYRIAITASAPAARGAALATVTPIPGSAGMLVTALAVVGAAFLRRRTTAAQA
jgi:hypothetical protein